ncbi:MAG: phosphodiester glycosidase family protein [Clostridia bacterium]|nr:phosphodiester glycosidase family protein [Clostridia bacterium]
MTGKTRKLLIRFAAFLLIWTFAQGVLPASAEEPAGEPAVLPLDFSGGMAMDRNGFGGGWSYEDPTISVSITRNTASLDKGNCVYWVASIKIKHASQLRTMAANGFEFSGDVNGSKMAKRVNAVLAISGDSYNYTGHGLIVRQGRVYLNALQGDRDVLVVDEDGDFHIVTLANRGDIGPTIKGKKVINTFFFGPALVLNGKAVWNMSQLNLNDDMRAYDGRQRMCIAQVGPLEYKCICCGPPENGSVGMTIPQFAQLVASLGVQTAYNLDGGYTTKMYFAGTLVNDISKTDRPITDIIYFASALGADSSAASQYSSGGETGGETGVIVSVYPQPVYPQTEQRNDNLTIIPQ